MIGRRSVIGIAVLCALALSAFAAASASAANTTAVTCAPVGEGPEGTKGFKDAHCKEGTENTKAAPNVVKYEHKEITSPTEIWGTNERTSGASTSAKAPAKLEGTAAGIVTAIQCTTVAGMGSLENKETAGKEMYAHGTGTIEYTGCTVTKPAEKGCVVKGGAITTNELTASTEGLATQAQFKPVTGTEFVSITIEKCSVVALNNTYPVAGSVKATISGATLTTEHGAATTENTLKFAGQKAGLSGSLTLGMGPTPIVDGRAITVT